MNSQKQMNKTLQANIKKNKFVYDSSNDNIDFGSSATRIKQKKDSMAKTKVTSAG